MRSTQCRHPEPSASTRLELVGAIMGQPRKNSKRARKEKDKKSLRQKRRADGPLDGGGTNPILDAQLQAGWGPSRM